MYHTTKKQRRQMRERRERMVGSITTVDTPCPPAPPPSPQGHVLGGRDIGRNFSRLVIQGHVLGGRDIGRKSSRLLQRETPPEPATAQPDTETRQPPPKKRARTQQREMPTSPPSSPGEGMGDGDALQVQVKAFRVHLAQGVAAYQFADLDNTVLDNGAFFALDQVPFNSRPAVVDYNAANQVLFDEDVYRRHTWLRPS